MPPLRFTHKPTGKTLLLDTPLTTSLTDLRHQLFSLTDIPPHRLTLHINDRPIPPNDRLDPSRTLPDLGHTPSATLYYDALPSTPPSTPPTVPPPAAPPAVELAASSIALSDVQAALHKIRLASTSRRVVNPRGSVPVDRETAVFLSRVKRYWHGMHAYEDFELQQRVRAVMPMSELKQRAEVRVGSEPRYGNKDRALLKEVLVWYKREFMVWVNAPECWGCAEGEVRLVGMVAPTEVERRYGGERVEGYECGRCGARSRFARYNDVGKLLETRRGRCGEWAQVFTAMMRAVGLRARMVHDWTDHVWTEVWCEGGGDGGGWVHADSCEDTMDEPLLYEAGWGKKLNYCVATGVDCVIDVTRRYTRKWDEVKERRVLAEEGVLSRGLEALNRDAMSRVAAGGLAAVRERYAWDVQDLQACKEEEEGRGSLPGRQSGAKEWVEARGEDGGDK